MLKQAEDKKWCSHRDLCTETYNILQLMYTCLIYAKLSSLRYLSAHKDVVSQLIFAYITDRSFQTDGSEHLLSTVDRCCKVDLLPRQRKMQHLRR